MRGLIGFEQLGLQRGDRLVSLAAGEPLVAHQHDGAAALGVDRRAAQAARRARDQCAGFALVRGDGARAVDQHVDRAALRQRFVQRAAVIDQRDHHIAALLAQRVGRGDCRRSALVVRALRADRHKAEARAVALDQRSARLAAEQPHVGAERGQLGDALRAIAQIGGVRREGVIARGVQQPDDRLAARVLGEGRAGDRAARVDQHDRRADRLEALLRPGGALKDLSGRVAQRAGGIEHDDIAGQRLIGGGGGRFNRLDRFGQRGGAQREHQREDKGSQSFHHGSISFRRTRILRIIN